jgi:predicted LPLAT superfamily acyltransferase
MPDLTKPNCVNPASTPFDTYITTCLTTTEQSRANNIIDSTKIREVFQKEQAIQTDLFTSLSGVQALNSSGLKVVPSIELNSLNSKLADINQQIKDNEAKTEVQNQKFLQSITSAPKSSYLLANYQDVALMFFFGSMVLFTIVMTFVQFSKKDGTVKGAAAAFLAMVVMIIVTYGLVKEVA